MKTLKVNTCYVMCSHYADLEDEEQDPSEHLLCCVCTLYRPWRWKLAMLCVHAVHVWGGKLNKETEWTLAMLCVYVMKILKMKNKTRMTTYYVVCCSRYAGPENEEGNKMNTCIAVCVRYEDTEGEHLLCCVFALWIPWRWRTRPERQLFILCVYAMQILKMKNSIRMTTYYAVCVRYADLEDEVTRPEWQLAMLCMYAI